MPPSEPRAIYRSQSKDYEAATPNPELAKLANLSLPEVSEPALGNVGFVPESPEAKPDAEIATSETATEPELSQEFKDKVDAITQLSDLAAMKDERLGDPVRRREDGSVNMPPKDPKSAAELTYIRQRQEQIAAQFKVEQPPVVVEPVVEAPPVVEPPIETPVPEPNPEPAIPEPDSVELTPPAVEPVPEPEPTVVVEPEPVAEPEPVVETEPIAEPEQVVEPEPEPAVVAEPKIEPTPEPTPPVVAPEVAPSPPKTPSAPRGRVSGLSPDGWKRVAEQLSPKVAEKIVAPTTVEPTSGAKSIKIEPKSSERVAPKLSPEKIEAARKRGAELAAKAPSNTAEKMSQNVLGRLEQLVPGLEVLSNSGGKSIDQRLELARTALAKLEMRDRHRLLPGEGRKVEIEAAKAAYEDAFRLRLVEKLHDGLENGKTEKEMQLAAVALLSEEARAKSVSEYEASQKLPGARVAKFLKEHNKLRIGVGVGLAVVGVGATFAGLAPIAMGAVGARALISGTTAFVGARRGITMAEAHRTRTGQRSRATIEDEDIKSLQGSAVYEKIAGYLGSDALVREVSNKKYAQDDEQFEKLMAAEESRLLTKLGRESQLKNQSVAEITMRILGERLQIEQSQLEADRNGNRARTLAALAIGVTAGIVTASIGVSHAEAAGKVKLRDIVKPKHPTRVHTGVTNAHVGYNETHLVHSGDSMWKISHDTLAAQDHGWSQLSPREQLIKTDRLKDLLLKAHHGKSLIMPGQKIKVPWTMVKDAVAYKQ